MEVRSSRTLAILGIWGLCMLGSTAGAYDQYSENGDDTNCGTCHGDFRSNLYFSNTDGELWGNLHNIHRQDMLDGDCDACHIGANRFPVFLNASDGGDGLLPISCVGCHGRNEDNVPENPDFGMLTGYGAGLRQQHTTADVNVCMDCHDDADPANYTPVGENVLPEYYANPGTGHPAMPTDPCNLDGNEDFAGIAEGLDNDGDVPYDGDDSDCIEVGTPEIVTDAGLYIRSAPNPFNPEAAIRIAIPSAAQIRLDVYSAGGEHVRTIVGSRFQSAGVFEVRWDGRDDRGDPLASGVYFYRLRAGHLSVTERLVLVR